MSIDSLPAPSRILLPVDVRELDTPYHDVDTDISVATPSCCCCCSCCLTAAIVIPVAAALDTGDQSLESRSSPAVVTLAMLAVMAAGLTITWLSFFDHFFDTDVWRWSALAMCIAATIMAMTAVRSWAGESTPRSIRWSTAVVAAWSAGLVANFVVDLIALPLLLGEWFLIPLWCALLIWRSHRRRERWRDRASRLDVPPDHDPYERFRTPKVRRAHDESDGNDDD